MPLSDPSLTLKHLELDTLLDITNAINRQQDEKSLLKIFLFTVVANFKVNKLLVFSREIGGWVEVLRHGVDQDFSISSKDLHKISNTFSITDFSKTNYEEVKEHFDVSIPVGRESRNVAMVLIGGSKRLLEQGFESVKFIQTIANILTVAIQNIRLNNRRLEQQAVKKEMELARKLQSQLFPRHLPNTEKLAIFATYKPQFTVGGDYYDYIELSDGNFIVCIADVSGKGVPAAFIMSNLQSALRILANQGLKLEQIVKELNTIVYHNAQGEKFVTFFIAKYMPAKNKIVYINCGHNAPLFFTSDKEFISLDKGSLILGAFDALPVIETGKIENIDESLLFSYTDGLVESFERTDIDKGLDIIKEIILNNKSLPELNKEILDKLDIKNSAMDDITMLSCYFRH